MYNVLSEHSKKDILMDVLFVSQSMCQPILFIVVSMQRLHIDCVHHFLTLDL